MSEKSKLNYAWIICAAGTLTMFCTSGLTSTGFTVYLPFLREDIGLTDSQISMIIFIRNLTGILSMVCVNRMIRKLEIRRVLTLSLILTGAGFAVYSVSESYTLFCIGSALTGMGFGTGGMIPVSILISRWFIEHRALAVGACMASTGLSSFAATPVITRIIQTSTVGRAFLIETIFITVIAAAVYTVVRNRPEETGRDPLGINMNDVGLIYAEHTASNLVLWIMIAGWLFLGMAANNIVAYLSVLFRSYGFDAGSISAYVSIFGLSLAIGKCLCGQMADKLGVSVSSTVLFILSIVGMIICSNAGKCTTAMIFAGVVMTGMGMAVASVATTTYASSMAESEDYPKIVSRFQTAQILGGLVYSPFPGIIAEHTGSYYLPYILMTIFVIISAVLLQGTYIRIKGGIK